MSKCLVIFKCLKLGGLLAERESESCPEKLVARNETKLIIHSVREDVGKPTLLHKAIWEKIGRGFWDPAGYIYKGIPQRYCGFSSIHYNKVNIAIN